MGLQLPVQWNSAGRTFLSGVAVFIAGAIFTMMLRASGADQRIATADTELIRQDARIQRIETSLANGGPPALAARVDAMSLDLTDMKLQIRDIWQVTVRGRMSHP